MLDCSDSGALVAVCKDILLFSSPPLGLELQITGAACSFLVVLSASRSYWLAATSMCACGRSFALVTQEGVILPCHPPCSSVLLLLRQSLCLHVESGDAKRGAGWGKHLLASPFLRCRQWFWRDPSCFEVLLACSSSRNWTLCYPQLRKERQERAPLVCTWQQRADGEGEDCLPLSSPSNQCGWGTPLKPKPHSPLWVSRMQRTGWDGFCSSAAVKKDSLNWLVCLSASCR